MAVVVETPKLLRSGIESFIANSDLSSYQYRALVAVAASSGKMLVDLNTTQGGKIVGILLNAPTAGQIADVAVMANDAPWQAGTTFNCGAELMSDSTGQAILATGGNYVGAVAKQASQAVGHVVATMLRSYKI
jgi:hypothetical protein